MRLAIVASLAANEFLDFNTLKELLEITDGNLASHLKALEKEDLIAMEKSFIGRKPNTRYKISTYGRKALQQHLLAIEQLIKGQK